MGSTLCTFCQKPASSLVCGVCDGPICKACVQSISSESFSFLEEIPSDLKFERYCPHCFDQKVAPELQSYNQTMARARQVNIFYKKQSKETRLFRRNQKRIHVANCNDRDEAILRLAFLAAKANFNTIIDVDVTSDKIRNFGYQTAVWKCEGIPVQSNV